MVVARKGDPFVPIGELRRATTGLRDGQPSIIDGNDRIMSRLVLENHGTWHKSTGDGMLATFDDSEIVLTSVTAGPPKTSTLPSKNPEGL